MSKWIPAVSAAIVIIFAALALASDWGGVKAQVDDNTKLIEEIRKESRKTQEEIKFIRIAIERLVVQGERE